MRVSASEEARPLNPWLAVIAGWAVPGLAHLLMGRWRKGIVFLAALAVMFFLGLILQGRLFPLDRTDPLVALAAVAEVGVGLIYLLASPLGYGAGKVVAVTYEYGNAFLIVAGLLNMLVVLDAYDIALGRK